MHSNEKAGHPLDNRKVTPVMHLLHTGGNFNFAAIYIFLSLVVAVFSINTILSPNSDRYLVMRTNGTIQESQLRHVTGMPSKLTGGLLQSFVHSSIRSFIHSFSQSVIHSFISRYLFVHLFMC